MAEPSQNTGVCRELQITPGARYLTPGVRYLTPPYPQYVLKLSYRTEPWNILVRCEVEWTTLVNVPLHPSPHTNNPNLARSKEVSQCHLLSVIRPDMAEHRLHCWPSSTYLVSDGSSCNCFACQLRLGSLHAHSYIRRWCAEINDGDMLSTYTATAR